MKTPIEEAQDKPEKEDIKVNENPDELMGVGENIEYHRVADFLEVDYNQRQDPVLAEKIDYIYRWGQDTSGSEERIDALMAVKNLIKGMGITDKGEKMIKKIYKWIRLDTSRKRIEKEMQLLK